MFVYLPLSSRWDVSYEFDMLKLSCLYHKRENGNKGQGLTTPTENNIKKAAKFPPLGDIS